MKMKTRQIKLFHMYY